MGMGTIIDCLGLGSKAAEDGPRSKSTAIEDLVGKWILLLLLGNSARIGAVDLFSAFREDGFDTVFSLSMTSRILSFAFAALLVLLTFRRIPAKASADGIDPKISAFIGTFAIALMSNVPLTASEQLQAVASGLLFTGTALSLVCLSFLGRSFSIMASARKLVTSGPYSIVRHPLYVAEQIGVVGIILVHLSLAALAIGALHLVFQLRRIMHEERILTSTFPEYREYASRVPMLVPKPASLLAKLKPGSRSPHWNR